MSVTETIVETHQCIYTRVPVDQAMCVRLSSVVAKNHAGCCVVGCTSEWRLCRTCVTLAEKDRSNGPIDPVSGLCEMHGGVITPPQEVLLGILTVGEEVLEIPVDQISRMPNQPRRHFDPDDMKSLAESIKHRGQIHPGLVVRTPNGLTPFELRDGERRWRACKIAERPFRATVQKSVEEGANDALLTSAAANFNRADHTPWEEIDLVRRLLSPCPDTGKKYSAQQVAESLGKDQVWISQRKVAGERLTETALEYISEKVDIPFTIIKQVADLPPNEQLTAFEDYRAGKVKMVALQSRAGAHRQAQGLSRQRKPSDIWSGAALIVKTIDTKVDRVCEVYSPQLLGTTLKEIAKEQGESIAVTLDELAERLMRAARLIRAAK